MSITHGRSHLPFQVRRFGEDDIEKAAGTFLTIKFNDIKKNILFLALYYYPIAEVGLDTAYNRYQGRRIIFKPPKLRPRPRQRLKLEGKKIP